MRRAAAFLVLAAPVAACAPPTPSPLSDAKLGVTAQAEESWLDDECAAPNGVCDFDLGETCANCSDCRSPAPGPMVRVFAAGQVDEVTLDDGTTQPLASEWDYWAPSFQCIVPDAVDRDIDEPGSTAVPQGLALIPDSNIDTDGLDGFRWGRINFYGNATCAGLSQAFHLKEVCDSVGINVNEYIVVDITSGAAAAGACISPAAPSIVPINCPIACAAKRKIGGSCDDVSGLGTYHCVCSRFGF
jgi:hypothetical protein